MTTGEEEERMSNKNIRKSDTGFLLQGTILAAASIISRIIGLVYRVPLTAIIGKTGNDFYGTAYEIYNIILLISSYSLPLAVSKLVAARMAKGQAKDAYRVLKGSLLFAGVSGTAAMAIVYFGADFFTGTLLKTPLSSIALKVLAPTLLIVAIVGVCRGFAQGPNTMMPSAISQIAEQIMNAVVSVVAAWLLFSYGAKVGAVLGDEDAYAAAYGAAGGTAGTLAGAATALIFILFVFVTFRRRFLRKVRRDRTKVKEAFGTMMKVLILTTIPVLLSTTIYNISSIIDNGIFKNIAHLQGYDATQISEWWGVFTGQYKVLINVPVSIASAMSASCVPSLTAAFHAGEKKSVRTQIHSSTRFIMVIAIPCAVGMAVLAQPIMRLLFNDADPLSGQMMMAGAIAVVFYSLSTLSNGLLQGIDRLKVPVKNAAVALVLHIVFLVGCMLFFHLNIFAVVLANAFYALCMCVLNGLAVRRYSGTRQNLKTTYLVPIAASAVMGVAVFGSYRLLELLSGYNAVATIVSIIVGVAVYAVALLLMKGLTEEDLKRFPKGYLLVNIAKKLRLMK